MAGVNECWYADYDQNPENNASICPGSMDIDQSAVPNRTDPRIVSSVGQNVPPTHLPTAADDGLEGQTLPPVSANRSADINTYGSNTGTATQAQESTSRESNHQDANHRYENSYDQNSVPMQALASQFPTSGIYRGGYGQGTDSTQGYGMDIGSTAYWYGYQQVQEGTYRGGHDQNTYVAHAIAAQPQNASQPRRHGYSNRNPDPRTTSGATFNSREHDQRRGNNLSAVANGSRLPQQRPGRYRPRGSGRLNAAPHRSTGQMHIDSDYAADSNREELIQNASSNIEHGSVDEGVGFDALAEDEQHSSYITAATPSAYAWPSSTAEAAPTSTRRVLPNVPSNRGGRNDQGFYKYHSSEFWVGRVLKIMWPEPMGADANATTWSTFSNDIYTKDRRFVILKTYKGHCLCVPIMTYGNQGCKPGAYPEYHGIVYTSKKIPSLRPGEAKLGFSPVQMISENNMEQLNPASRINYRKDSTIEYNYRVNFVGYLDKADFSVIQEQLQNKQGDDQYGRSP